MAATSRSVLYSIQPIPQFNKWTKSEVRFWIHSGRSTQSLMSVLGLQSFRIRHDMRRIDRTCLATMQSPIRHLMADNLGNSVFNIAPERKSEFDISLDNFDLIYTNERRWKFCADADPSKRVVFVSRGAVELIWCSSLADFLLYTRLIQGKKLDRPTEIDPHSDGGVSNALKLLRWAIICQLENDTADNWPPNLPIPQETPADGPDNAANELCLVSCAFLLHHELAHIRLRHSAGVDNALSLSQEKEADIAAAEWVLDGIDADSLIFVKRMLGVVQAFLLATAIGLYGGNLGGNSHPFSYDRLTSLLNRFLGNANHITKAIAFAVLALHFKNSGRTLKKQAFADPEEALEALCNQLAEEFHARATKGARK